MRQLKNIKYLYSALSICLIGVGLLLLNCPGMAVEIIYRLGGVVLCLFGIVKMISYFSKDIFQLAFQFDLAIGIVFAVMGICLLLQPKRIMEMVTAIIGIIMLLDALLRVQTTIDAKRFGIEKWWVLLLISLTAAVIGTLLLLRPFKGAKIIISLVGLNLCFNGILNFVIVQNTVRTTRRK